MQCGIIGRKKKEYVGDDFFYKSMHQVKKSVLITKKYGKIKERMYTLHSIMY